MAIRTIFIGNVNLPAGTRQSPAFPVPVGFTELTALVDVSNHTNPARGWSVAMEASFDGGLTWIPWGGAARSQGGVALNKLGNPVTECGVKVDLLDPNNPLRRLRGAVTITGGTLRTGLSVILGP